MGFWDKVEEAKQKGTQIAFITVQTLTGIKYFWEDPDQSVGGNLITQVSSDVVDELITESVNIITEGKDEAWLASKYIVEEILSFIQNIDWVQIGEALGKALAYGFRAFRDGTGALIEEVGPITVKASRNAYKAVSEVFSDGGVEIFAAFTTGLLLVMGFIYLIRYVYHAPIAHLGLSNV